MKKRSIFAVMLCLMLAFPMIVNAAFNDLAAEHWAAGFINELTNKGVINGYPDGSFKPEGTLTKAEFIKLIMSASLPDMDFAEAPKDFEHWAASFIKVAENYNVLTDGEINQDNLDTPITRIEVIKILSLCDINIRKNSQLSVNDLNFTDVNSLSVSEQILLSHAVASGIISGYPDGSFKPANNLTRAEASKILSVYINK